ncbi:MAG: hypothetical protein ACRD0H_19480, partial [Actinomycetes bacterium]
PGPPPLPLPLPSRLGLIHVAQVRDLTRRLGEAGNHRICDAEVLGGAAAWATQQLDVPGAEPVKRALGTAVAELHIEAGWAAFAAGLYRRALYHYARALELAIEAKDVYLQALALNYAGIANVEHGEPNDGLKLLQLGRVKAWDIPPDDQRAVVVGENGKAAVEATALADSATALADLGHLNTADTDMATARELWRPTRCDPYGDLDRPAARLAMRRGRLDLAETLAVASVRRWEGGSPISRTQSAILLATIHVQAGEPDGLSLAHSAVTSVPKLSSRRARRCLEPLVVALEARPGTEAKDLARMTRQVATTRT